MKFVKNGPDIPELLLQAHEEGKVIFFCGSGISRAAGLPDFKNLVKQIFLSLDTKQNPIEKQAFKKYQYDATLDLLERRYSNQRIAVRKTLLQLLQPKATQKSAYATHKALLQLATERSGKVKLVTTNFDRIFQDLILQQKLGIPTFEAPLLPIPKTSHWNGIVYLHGLMPKTAEEQGLNRLVLTSGDFGLAYLVERWAARFVSELFLNYTVCFVGYSIDDPVLRYMMDALAADERRGEKRPKAYAFGSYSSDNQDKILLEWEAKGVIPLLYDDQDHHKALHATLREWADTYRDGVQARELIVTQHAATLPLTNSRIDFAVGRILWAMTDGLAAKRFANLSPVPPLEWLQVFEEQLFTFHDLPLFGMPIDPSSANLKSFSFVSRPQSCLHAPKMCLVGTGDVSSEWDDTMFQIAGWLTRHLNDPNLILWLAQQGGQLHKHFSHCIGSKIKHLDRLTKEGNNSELDRIRANAPNAIPDEFMRVLWRLILSGRLRSSNDKMNIFVWLNRFDNDGLTASLRIELREILTPRISLRAPFQLGDVEPHASGPQNIRELVDWEIVLAGDHLDALLRGPKNESAWKSALPDLLFDFSMLLRDTLDLMRELGGADDHSDLSYIFRPSISDHEQNRGYREWTILIDLIRNAWLASAETDVNAARLVADFWWLGPYPLFKRLAFFAATHEDIIPEQKALDWLLDSDGWWLWSIETQCEAMRLIAKLYPGLKSHNQTKLENAILQGPPRTMFIENMELDRWNNIVDHEIWMRITKLHDSGIKMRSKTRAKFNELSKKHPDWPSTANTKDEFPFRTSSSMEWHNFVATPKKRTELIEFLQHDYSNEPWHKDDWQQRCRDNFSTTSCALWTLAKKGKWLDSRWREALQVWAEDKHLKRSWRYMAKILVNAPVSLISSIRHSLAWWLQAQAKTFNGSESLFFILGKRILDLDYSEEDHNDDDPVFSAINHPVGYITEALLRWWYRQPLEKGQGLPDEIKPIFTTLCDTNIKIFRYSRILFASHLTTLFQVDEAWTSENLLPRFDWNCSRSEARYAWIGFLRAPKLLESLMAKLKQPFLATAKHYMQLGQHAEQYAALLTFAAMSRCKAFTLKNLSLAAENMPEAGIRILVQTMTSALEASGEQRQSYFQNRVKTCFKSMWPKTRTVISSGTSEDLALLCVAARENFPEALELVKGWLQTVEYMGFIVTRLQEAGLSEQFPDEALDFLTRLIGETTQCQASELALCLDAMRSKMPSLKKDSRFMKLLDYQRRHTHE